MLKLVVVCAVFAMANAAVYRELQEIKEGEAYMCKDEDGHTWEPGTSYYPKGQCIQKNCQGVSKTQVEISGLSCGVIGGVSEECLVSDLSKNYPDCCPTVKEGC